MVGTKGGRSGPNLSRVGRQRSYAFLRESVVNPSAEITPGYRTVSVVLGDGKKIVGLERGLDNFTVQLVDLSGHFYSLDKSGLKSVTQEKRSLMPDNYGKTLTGPELDDLIAYLATLRGEVSKP
jgi:putative heme-binding domain-containing protein